MALHIKKGDTVQIIAGNHKNATGVVLRVLRSKGKVLIEGHNRRYKHIRPSQQNPKGGRIRIEQPVDMSNVLPVSPKGSKGTRVRYKTASDGTKTREAIDGTQLSVLRKAKAKK